MSRRGSLVILTQHDETEGAAGILTRTPLFRGASTPRLFKTFDLLLFLVNNDY